MTNTNTVTTFYVGLKNPEMDKTKVDPEDVIGAFSEMVKGGTFTEARGLWKGETEPSIKFEVANLKGSLTDQFKEAYSDELDDGRAPFKIVQEAIADQFNQDSVMVKRQTAGIHF